MAPETGAALEQRTIMEPATGQVVSLDLPTGDLGFVLDEVRDLEGRIREFKRKVNEELLARFDRDRKWTVRDGSYELSAPSDALVPEWDEDSLAWALQQLVDLKRISQEAMDAAIEQVVEWKVKPAGIKALAKNPELAEVIDGCKTDVPNERRYVRVKPLR